MGKLQQLDPSTKKKAIVLDSASTKKRTQADYDDDKCRKVIVLGSSSTKCRTKHDSDDDFETPMRKADKVRSLQVVEVASRKRKQPEQQKITVSHSNNKGKGRSVNKAQSGKDASNNKSNEPQIYKDITRKRIRTRSNPLKLFTLMKELNEPQMLAVELMGFGSLRHLSVHRIPTRLGLWLVTNYDHQNNCLNVGTHTIQITRELIADVLGIPMGDVRVNYVKKPSKKDPVILRWRNQFGTGSNLKTVKDVTDFIKASDDSGRMFMLNYLVVFNTIMGVTTKGGHVNMKFLPSVTPNADINKMDWCSYLIECLRKTKRKWSGLEHYNGH
ncbi:hypothetical protein Hdeb2414_s0012g00396271 [Helianthus debilis subsp. tardiflorus]